VIPSGRIIFNAILGQSQPGLSLTDDIGAGAGIFFTKTSVRRGGRFDERISRKLAPFLDWG